MFAERGGIAQQMHMARQTLTEIADLALQLLHLLEHQPRMAQNRVPGLSGMHAAPLAHQQRRIHIAFHATNALAGRGE